MKQFKPRIIIIDDEPIVLYAYKKKFEYSFNAVVYSTTDPEEALRVAIEMPPDLFITDIKHPGINGISLTKRLRENENTRLLPIWVISGQAKRKDGDMAAAAGADAVISKPFSFEDLARRFDNLLKSRRVYKQSPNNKG